MNISIVGTLLLLFALEEVDASNHVLFHNRKTEDSVPSVREDFKEDETETVELENKRKHVNGIPDSDKEETNKAQDRITEGKGEGNEKKSTKRSHPQVCPPGWLSPWDYADRPNSDCGGEGYGGHCGCGGGNEGDGCDVGYGCGVFACGCGECGCRFHGGFRHQNGFGRRFPQVFNDGHIQHVWLSE